MEVIRKINAIIICVIISLVLTLVVICAFPFCTVIELIVFIRELQGDEEFEHNLWPGFISNCAGFVKESYRKMISEPLTDLRHETY